MENIEYRIRIYEKWRRKDIVKCWNKRRKIYWKMKYFPVRYKNLNCRRNIQNFPYNNKRKDHLTTSVIFQHFHPTPSTIKLSKNHPWRKETGKLQSSISQLVFTRQKSISNQDNTIKKAIVRANRGLPKTKRTWWHSFRSRSAGEHLRVLPGAHKSS